MSSRYPPPPRERSPPRHFDRRPTTQFPNGGSSYRASNEPSPGSADRAPPRGPRADSFRGSYQFGSAGRGRGSFAVRGSDTWDRERDRDRERDTRNAPPFRRDEDRQDRQEWPRRERDAPTRDRGAAPASGERRESIRDRSASPERPRRNSRENISTARAPDSASSYYAPSARGGAARGRGRGDWERGRDRSSFVGDRDRDGLYPRSRSREGWRDRDFERGRPGAPDSDRVERGERRDYERGDDREIRGREHDIWRGDRSPERSSAGRGGSPGALSTASQHGPTERQKIEYDLGRKSGTTAAPLTSRSEGRRDADADYFSSRMETTRRDGPTGFQSATAAPIASSLGLDYGPDPTALSKPSSISEKAPPKPLQARIETPSAPAALQPPSGPRAERSGSAANTPSTPRVASHPFDPRPKPDSVARPLRQPQATGALGVGPDPSLKTPDVSSDLRTPTSATSERTLPANTPSGPRSIGSGPYKSRMPAAGEQASPVAPPTAPRQPKATSPVLNAPTGPRSSGFGGLPGVPTGPQAGSSRPRMGSDFRPKPSIMNQLNKPYQSDLRDRPAFPPARAGGVYQNQLSPRLGQTSPSQPGSATMSLKSSTLLPRSLNPRDEEVSDSPADIEMSMPPSDEDEGEDDDDAFDEADFAATEESHAKEMRILEARKPPPPFSDLPTVVLAMRIRMADLVAQDIIPDAYEEIKSILAAAEPLDVGIGPKHAPPSPGHTPHDPDHPAQPKPRGRPLKEPFVHPIPTPPIDELPYLNRAVDRLTVDESIVFDDDVSMDEHNETMVTLVQHDCGQEQERDNADLDTLHSFYTTDYARWRNQVDILERVARDSHLPSPAPASPAPSATPSLPPPAATERAIERTRGGRNATDLDMQTAIRMSQQSAMEEDARRELESTAHALPNYDTEAVVPYMIPQFEAKLELFEDTNQKIEHEHALQFFEFLPREDDFTQDEQLAFIAAYCQNPKKWGKISQAVRGRTYQECIAHYYLTKDDTNYKEHLRRSQPKRKRGRASAKQPKSNNLLSDLALNQDSNGTTVAMTDSGRPKRAAAPTFGDVVDGDAAAAAATSTKRTATANKDAAEPGTSKSTRGRKPGATKGRKPKDKTLLDSAHPQASSTINPEISPQKGAGMGRDKSRAILKAESAPHVDALGTSSVPGPSTADSVNITGAEALLVTSRIQDQPVVTSYWSVPETQKFAQLIQYFGRDWAAIADFYRTKSAQMIRNHFIKETERAGRTELITWADNADARRKRGEDMGPPPTPVQPPRRRYEATPSTLVAATRAPFKQIDNAMPETEQIRLSAKSVVEDFPPNSIQRSATGEIVANFRPNREILQPASIPQHVHPKTEETARDRPALMQKPPSGPPRGMFQEDHHGYLPQHNKAQRPLEASPHQHAAGPDLRATEYQTQQRGSSAAMPPSRESLIQAPQPGPALVQYQPSTERNLQPGSRGHSRNGSLVNPQSMREQQAAADLASLASHDPVRSAVYGLSAAHSPANMYAQASVNPGARPGSPPHQIPPRVEPPKEKVMKRSNIMDMLNNDDTEPPVKRPSTASAKRAVNTPPPTSMASQPLYGQHGRYADDPAGTRPPQSVYNPNNRVPEYPAGYSVSPAPASAGSVVSGNEWFDKLDPRKQSHQGHEQRTSHQSVAPGPYSLVPPATQSTPGASAPTRYDPRNVEQGLHRSRSLLGISHAPSPPPPPPAHPAQGTFSVHRENSGSSTHGRGLSAAYPSQPLSQHSTPTSSHAPPAYSHSTSSTPVSSLHQHNQSSTDYSSTPSRRLTIQKHLAQEEQRVREHDRTLQHREMDMLRQPSQQRPHDRRELYAAPAPPSGTAPPPHAGVGYATQSPRTVTPPNSSYGAPANHIHHVQAPPPPHHGQYSLQHHPAQQGPMYNNAPGLQYGNRPPDQRDSRAIPTGHSMPNQQPQQTGPYRYGADDRR